MSTLASQLAWSCIENMNTNIVRTASSSKQAYRIAWKTQGWNLLGSAEIELSSLGEYYETTLRCNQRCVYSSPVAEANDCSVPKRVRAAGNCRRPNQPTKQASNKDASYFCGLARETFGRKHTLTYRQLCTLNKRTLSGCTSTSNYVRP